MPVFTLAVLAISFAYAAFQSAGTTPDWNWSVCAIGITAAIYFIANARTPMPRLDRLSGGALVAFLSVAVLQLIPFPVWFIHFLSPARVELSTVAGTALGHVPSWITISIVPWTTFTYLIRLVTYALVFLVIREITLALRPTAYRWAPVWPLLAVAAAEGALGFYQTYAENAEGFARGTYGNRDHYAGLLELLLPFAVLYPIAILNRDRKRHESPARPALKACGVMALGAMILIGVMLSLSRMAFISSLCALFIAGALALSLRRSYLPIGVLGVVILLAFVFLPTDPLIARFSEFASTENISADTRAQIWRETSGLVREYPVFGCGLGCYESAFYRFKSVAPMNTVDYAHNDYLQVLAEMGVVGFGLGVLFVALVLRSAIRNAVYSRSLDDRLLSVACIASLMALFLHSFVDFNMYVPANALAVAWIAGISGTRLGISRGK